MPNLKLSLAARLRLATAAPLAALLVACGGGGGEDALVLESPPGTAATLSDSTESAARAAEAAVAGAEAVLSGADSLRGVLPVVELPLSSSRSMPQAQRQRPMDIDETALCTRILLVPCTGTVRLETNLNDLEGVAPAGSHLALRFNDFSGSLDGDSIAFAGRVRIEFLESFDLSSEGIAGLDLRIDLRSFGGSVNGIDFGPITVAMRLQAHNEESISLTLNGHRFSGLSDVLFEDDGNYHIGSGRVRSAYWADAARHVDLDLNDWTVSNGRPTVASQGIITAGDDSIVVIVESVGSTTVVYHAAITVGGTTVHYVVTATYAGSGAPSYSAVLVS